MKAKKNHGNPDNDGRKNKQVSVPKKRRLLKKQSQVKDENSSVKRWKPSPSSKLFKGNYKKIRKSRSEDTPRSGKSVSFSEDLEGHNKSKKKSSLGRSNPKKSIKARKKLEKKKMKLQKMKSAKKLASGTTSPGKRKRDDPATDEALNQERPIEAKKVKPCDMKKKVRKVFYKQKEPMFNMSVAAKKIWEVIRREDCAEATKINLISELMTLIKGQIRKLIFAHDTARVIECILATGTQDQRNQLFEELKDSLIPIAKSKYAKFFLVRMFKYGTKQQKDLIIDSFKGELVSLVKHSEASLVVETGFNEYANAKQRSEMIQEFYGPSFSLFKDENARHLQDILEKHPEQKLIILSHIKDMLLKITEKSVIRHSIVHHVLREFMTHADAQSRSEVIENIREAAVEILHTKDGARVAMNCLWHGTVKDRKKIVKSLKSHVCKVAKEEHGSLVLIALFDCVDDTKLVQEVIINKLCDHFVELAQDLHGRKVLSYLVCPRDSHLFHPDVVNILKAGDNNETSKKNPEFRRVELRSAASPLLLKLCCENVDLLVKTNATCIFLLYILLHATGGDRREALEAVASLLSSPFHEKSGNDLHPLEQPVLHFLTKKLLHGERDRKDNYEVLFSDVLVATVPKGNMKSWVDCNRGAFLLLMLLESGVPGVISRVRDELKGTYSQLGMKRFKGAELLLAELKKPVIE